LVKPALERNDDPLGVGRFGLSFDHCADPFRAVRHG